MLKLSLLLAGAIGGVSAFVSAPLREGGAQQPLGSGSVSAAASEFKCDLPPVLDPSKDGLPSATDLFDSKKAIDKQVKRHQAIVRVPSICFDDLGSVDTDERWKSFDELHAVVKRTYPIVHERAKLEKINRYGLLYTFEGTEKSRKPILLMAHQDVVPVADESTWKYPPFEAHYDGEFLWGRGASDDKNSLTAIMSVMETLLAKPSWKPARTIILAFGFDEECSGYRGAGEISKHLMSQYGENGMAIILDEGGLGLLSLDNNTLYALPAVTEKGHVDIWFELSVIGGHSSVPFPHTSIGIMAEIISTLEAHPYKAELIAGSPMHNHLMCQARYSPDADPKLTHMINKGDLDGVTDLLVKQSGLTQFLIQTSQAVDMIQGGQKINAMPEKTSLGVNYRVAPQNSLLEVQHTAVEHIKDIASKYGLKLKAYEGDEAYAEYAASKSPRGEVEARWDVDYKGTLVVEAKEGSNSTPISPASGPVWDIFSGSIQHTFAFEKGTVVPVGQIMNGNTDTRHYLELSDHIYRWSPSRHAMGENIHTINERISMADHMEMVKFYYDLVRNFDASEA